MMFSILPQNKRRGIFQYIKLPQRSFFVRIQDAIICFRDLLTFNQGAQGGKSFKNNKCTFSVIPNEIFLFVGWKKRCSWIFFSLSSKQLVHLFGTLGFVSIPWKPTCSKTFAISKMILPHNAFTALLFPVSLTPPCQ